MTASPSTIATRAALYLRVSTARQAEHDVSIPDQKRQGEAYCLTRGYQLVETFVEPGASATNDRRPEFQRMIEAGTSKPAPFDDTAVIGQHAGTIGVENADHADVHLVLAVVVEKERLGAAFPLIVAGADADRVDVSPVGFGLRMNARISVNLGGGGLENAGFDPLGEAEAVDRTDN